MTGAALAGVATACTLIDCSTRTASVAHRRAFWHPCSIGECRQPVKGRGLCEKHYMRAYRHAGDVMAGEGRYGKGYPTAQGYIATARTGHPLARAKGQVLLHRIILFEKIGPGTHPCHWCGRPVSWGYHVHSATLVTDHIDADKANNVPENLVPSCPGCNTRRARQVSVA